MRMAVLERAFSRPLRLVEPDSLSISSSLGTMELTRCSNISEKADSGRWPVCMVNNAYSTVSSLIVQAQRNVQSKACSISWSCVPPESGLQSSLSLNKLDVCPDIKIPLNPAPRSTFRPLVEQASGAHALSPSPTVMAMTPAMIPRFISLFSQ